MAPAPSPNGIAIRNRNRKCCEKKVRSKAEAVINTLTFVTTPVPNFRISFVLNKLDKIVPPDTVMEIYPAAVIGASKSSLITGHADPRIESGRPRLIKAR